MTRSTHAALAGAFVAMLARTSAGRANGVIVVTTKRPSLPRGR
jgi:hypothetical protein